MSLRKIFSHILNGSPPDHMVYTKGELLKLQLSSVTQKDNNSRECRTMSVVSANVGIRLNKPPVHTRNRSCGIELQWDTIYFILLKRVLMFPTVNMFSCFGFKPMVFFFENTQYKTRFTTKHIDICSSLLEARNSYTRSRVSTSCLISKHYLNHVSKRVLRDFFKSEWVSEYYFFKTPLLKT